MSKLELYDLLDEKFSDIFSYIENRPYHTFTKVGTSNKWCDGEHLDHLRKSTRAVNKGMGMPKLVLWYKFGKVKRKEHTYEELQALYYKYSETQIDLRGGVKAPKTFLPNKVTDADRSKILTRLAEEKENMINIIAKNSDKALVTYGLKHPALGVMSFKELVYFTAFHTEHHLKLMKRDNG